MTGNALAFRRCLDERNIWYEGFEDKNDTTICRLGSPLKNGLQIDFVIEFPKKINGVLIRTDIIVNDMKSVGNQTVEEYVETLNLRCIMYGIRFDFVGGLNLYSSAIYDIEKHIDGIFEPEAIIVLVQSMLEVINHQYEQLERMGEINLRRY